MFYEQYLTVVPEGLFMLSLCLVPTFAVCCLLLGMDLRSGLLNLFSIVMILVDTVGFMALWGISYNAVSLINLVTVLLGAGPHRHAPFSLGSGPFGTEAPSAHRQWASLWNSCPTSHAPLLSARSPPGWREPRRPPSPWAVR